ncbi:hypothetical protein ONZ45_g2253 [Pleurotus djamor]|nr:hypothetical protein ONZ45_g2253 [Pleurotus djamor]
MLSLSSNQRAVLKRGNVVDSDDLILTPPYELARRCKVSLLDIQTIVDAVCAASLQTLSPLHTLVGQHTKFSTGDPGLDDALGGGMQTGMVWEVAGESSAGKTQLALQLSLSVQLPPEQGGLSGATCYLTTSSKLPTTRLLEIRESRQSWLPSLCSLDHIHTLPVPTIPLLTQVLSTLLPQQIEMLSSTTRPIKLIVIDALAELFHDMSEKTTTNTLVERSRNISEIAQLLHSLASKHRICILVVNEVVDSFQRQPSNGLENELIYSEQSRWFARTNSVPQENAKEAALGLGWANQVNARIFLNRTGRRRYFAEDPTHTSKERKRFNSATPHISSDDASLQEALPIRRLSILFSSVSLPTSLDYIVTAAGISSLPDDNGPKSPPPAVNLTSTPDVLYSSQVEPTQSQLAPLDIGFVEDDTSVPVLSTEDPDSDWEQYWKDEDEFPADFYDELDLQDPSQS